MCDLPLPPHGKFYDLNIPSNENISSLSKRISMLAKLGYSVVALDKFVPSAASSSSKGNVTPSFTGSNSVLAGLSTKFKTRHMSHFPSQLYVFRIVPQMASSAFNASVKWNSCMNSVASCLSVARSSRFPQTVNKKNLGSRNPNLTRSICTLSSGHHLIAIISNQLPWIPLIFAFC